MQNERKMNTHQMDTHQESTQRDVSSYIKNLQEKYNLQPMNKEWDKSITLEEYIENQNKLRSQIDKFYPADENNIENKRKKAVIKELFEKNKYYRILELHENPPPDSLIKYFMPNYKGEMILHNNGKLIDANGLHILIRNLRNDRKKQVGRNNLILVKYTDNQINSIKQQSKFKSKTQSVDKALTTKYVIKFH